MLVETGGKEKDDMVRQLNYPDSFIRSENTTCHHSGLMPSHLKSSLPLPPPGAVWAETAEATLGSTKAMSCADP